MEKMLFHTLQEIKIILNQLQSKEYDKLIEMLKRDIKYEKVDYNKYLEELRKDNRDYYISNIKTLGRYRKGNKKLHEISKDVLDRCVQNSIDNVDYFEEQIENFTQLKEEDLEKQKTYKKNFEQINSFLELCKTMNDEEKEKMFNYKMNENNPYIEQITLVEEYRRNLTNELNDIKDVLTKYPREDKSMIVLDNLSKILVAISETLLALVASDAGKHINVVAVILVLLAAKNIVTIIKRDIRYVELSSDYDVVEYGRDFMESQLEKIEITSDFFRKTPKEELDKYLSYKIKDHN